MRNFFSRGLATTSAAAPQNKVNGRVNATRRQNMVELDIGEVSGLCSGCVSRPRPPICMTVYVAALPERQHSAALPDQSSPAKGEGSGSWGQKRAMPVGKQSHRAIGGGRSHIHQEHVGKARSIELAEIIDQAGGLGRCRILETQESPSPPSSR